MKLYRHDAVNSWLFFDKIHFLIIHPHERYFSWKIIKWNTRFNRFQIGDRFELQFGKIPESWLGKGNLLNHKPTF